MNEIRIHTLESAPEKSTPSLELLQKNFGFIPNTAAVMAGSPALIGAFVAAFGNFHASSLSAAEKQVVLLTNAVTFRCEWTTAFHSALASKEGVGASDVAAIRRGELPRDSRFAALSALARVLIERHGRGSEREIAALIAAGFEQVQVLDVIAGVAISTMAGFTANIAQPPVEERFKAHAWQAA